MNIRLVRILVLVSTLGVGAAVCLRLIPREQAVEPVAPVQAIQAEAPAEPPRPPEPDIRAALPPAPEPVAEVIVKAPPAEIKPPKPVQQPRPTAVNRRDPSLYWANAARHFEQMQDRLDRENHPEQRANLIRALAQNVRINTLATLDWAMSLEDPAERRAALEAINKYAISGIGARIEMDQTGLPKIRETTILSAIGSTGKVEAGDYISGIVNGDGSVTSLHGLSIQQIVQLLRGKPGSEVQLIMERAPTDGSTEPYSYDVPVLRSLIVMDPPY